VNKGKKKRKVPHHGTAGGAPITGLSILPGQWRPQGARASEETPGARENVLAALVGYMTLQFFGCGSSIRVPSSVVFVGTMYVV
jgi:hypothetical protein